MTKKYYEQHLSDMAFMVKHLHTSGTSWDAIIKFVTKYCAKYQIDPQELLDYHAEQERFKIN